MGVISRSFKNAFRNAIRTISITFILGLSIAMALIMLLAMKTVQSKIDTVKSSIGNTITVSPAGVRGFEGGGELLTEQNASDISSIAHVSSTVKTLSDRLETANTSLVSSIEAGSFGNRMRGNESSSTTNSSRSSDSNNTSSEKSFTMPVTVTGTNNLDSLTSLGVSQLTISDGQKFDANTSENVAIIGKELATKNNLSVGSTFTAYSQTITVVGIFDSGNTFTNGSAIMPLKTVQTISSQTDQVNSIIVQTDSIDSLAAVTSEIKTKLGDKVDVVSSEDSSKSAITPLENIRNISFYSLIGSLVAGAIIIFLTMIMIVRERRREIGVLKAIGSSNIKIVSQFVVESLVLTLMSSILGVILGFVFSNPVLKVLVNNSQTETSATGSSASGQFGGAGERIMQRMGSGLNNAHEALNNIHAVVGWDIILYGLLAAFIIAVIGSAIPAFFISKVRPAEVMRQE